MLNNNNTISKKCHYKHLTSSNRGQIQAYRNEGKSIRFIAKILGKNPSTISRELKRNSVTQMDSSYAFKDVYIADTAHILYKKRRQKCISRKQYDPLFFVELKKEILKKENRAHSIDTFCNVYKRNNLDKVIPSTKTVYEMIHRGEITGIKPYMLPRMTKLKPRRKTNEQSNAKKNKKVLGTSIEQRPEHINSREEKGHFEIDAVKGKNGKNEACIITLVDRRSRYTYILFLPKLNAQNVNKALQKLFRKVGKKSFKSITSDNGSEFSRLTELESKNMKVFFAHPYSSYERGTNENTNGLIREFLPKGESMNGKEKEIPEIQKILNGRCRKILDYRSAEEYHFDNTIA